MERLHLKDIRNQCNCFHFRHLIIRSVDRTYSIISYQNMKSKSSNNIQQEETQYLTRMVNLHTLTNQLKYNSNKTTIYKYQKALLPHQSSVSLLPIINLLLYINKIITRLITTTMKTQI